MNFFRLETLSDQTHMLGVLSSIDSDCFCVKSFVENVKLPIIFFFSS